MKRISLSIAVRISAAGPLPTVMHTSAPFSPLTSLHSPRSHTTFISVAPLGPLKFGKGVRVAVLPYASATNSPHFAHVQKSHFASRTRGLVQHDV
jgi:hypothetical protein